MDPKCLSCKKRHPSVCRPAFKCDRCHRRDEAAPEMLELLRATQELHAVVHVAGCDCAFCRRDRLLKRIDGDQP